MTSDVAARITQHDPKPGEWVALAREEAARRDGRKKPYSQMELAFAIGRDRNTIWRWESGEIDYFSWVGVLAILGLELEWEPGAPRPKSR